VISCKIDPLRPERVPHPGIVLRAPAIDLRRCLKRGAPDNVHRGPVLLVPDRQGHDHLVPVPLAPVLQGHVRREHVRQGHGHPAITQGTVPRALGLPGIGPLAIVLPVIDLPDIVLLARGICRIMEAATGVAIRIGAGDGTTTRTTGGRGQPLAR
jgi:hypothetical protein